MSPASEPKVSGYFDEKWKSKLGPGQRCVQHTDLRRPGARSSVFAHADLLSSSPAPRPRLWAVPGPMARARAVVGRGRRRLGRGRFGGLLRGFAARSVGGAGLPELLELAEGAERDASREGVLRQGGRRGRGLGGPGRGPRGRRPLEAAGSGAGAAVMGARAGSRAGSAASRRAAGTWTAGTAPAWFVPPRRCRRLRFAAAARSTAAGARSARGRTALAPRRAAGGRSAGADRSPLAARLALAARRRRRDGRRRRRQGRRAGARCRA